MKYIKYMLLIFLCVFSFYVSDSLLLYVENSSPLMQSINEYQDLDEYEPVNALVDGNTIIPGKKGRVVNKRESYLKMNDFGTFNETFFVYDYIDPEVSLEDNLDKVIIGALDKTKISIIVDTDKYDDYFYDSKIYYSKLVSSNTQITENEYIEYINGNIDEDTFYDLNYYLKRSKVDNKICIIGSSNIKACKANKYYLIDPSINLYHSNVAAIKSKISGGNILYIHDDVTLSELKVIINEINYKRIDIIKLSDLIKE